MPPAANNCRRGHCCICIVLLVHDAPLMQDHPHHINFFQQEGYTEAASLRITPAPDTLNRVFMAWQPSEDFVKMRPQELDTPERNGFTVVAWGGTIVKEH